MFAAQNTCWLLFIFACFPSNFGPVQWHPKPQGSLSPAVFQLDLPNPTADKPQSKLFYMDGHWWAILPTSSGPSLWKRGEKGWAEQVEVRLALTGQPARCDVWPSTSKVFAVGVSNSALSIFCLEKDRGKNNARWKTSAPVVLNMPEQGGDVETATITLDKKGCWWVAADCNKAIYVWRSDDGKSWTDPYQITDDITKDDICVVTPLPEGIGIIWSDQAGDAVWVRVHKDGDSLDNWSARTAIDQGHKTADDHLNTSLSSDGTLWVATKNSVDAIGYPQQVLRVRSKEGKWMNYPYAKLEVDRQPSRPIVIATENPSVVLSGYTIYHNKNPWLGEIVFGKVDTTLATLLTSTRAVITPDTTTWTKKKNLINNVTGPRFPYPAGAPWIVLASDGEGRVYEADLSNLR